MTKHLPLPVLPPMPAGWVPAPLLDVFDERLCHPDSITPRTVRARRKAVRDLARRRAAWDDMDALADTQPITRAEWRQEWADALAGCADNQAWAIPYNGRRRWIDNTAERGGARLTLVFRLTRNPASCLAYESRGWIEIENPHIPGRYDQFELAAPEARERLARYAWSKTPHMRPEPTRPGWLRLFR